MVVHVVKGETELSQFTIVPVYPLNVRVPLVDPEQMVVPPDTLPPTEALMTVTVVAEDVAGAPVRLPQPVQVPVARRRIEARSRRRRARAEGAAQTAAGARCRRDGQACRNPDRRRRGQA